jgi:hypothetical protein
MTDKEQLNQLIKELEQLLERGLKLCRGEKVE